MWSAKGENMKVAVLRDLKDIALVEKPVPKIGAGEALVKVEYCGICGSDVHAYAHGKVMQVGTVMGHECSGVVAEVGAEVDNVKVGDRVWVKPGASCGECHWCRKGLDMYCPRGFERAMGLTPNYDGAFAESVLVKYPREMLFKLPSAVSFEEAALVEPLSVGLHGIRTSRFKTGDSAVVVGAGMIGLGVLQFVKLGGAGKTVVLEASPQRSRIAKELGADLVLDPAALGEDLPATILDFTGFGADVVFECAGTPSALEGTVDYVSSGGQIMLLGLHEGKVPFDFWQTLHREIDVKGSLGWLDEYLYVLDFLERKRIATDRLINDVISLNDIEEKGFRRLFSSQDAVKILVKP